MRPKPKAPFFSRISGLAICLLVGLAVFTVFDRAAAETGYRWPVKGIAKKVTSVMADPRLDHPHAGIDLSLFGRIGAIPIVAVDDGVLLRLRDSKFGYGKAVYVRHADGKVTVYAHLSGFSSRLADLARSIRRRTGLERLDYYTEQWESPTVIGRGELLGYGGNSGTRTPHLHFELREDESVALNPLTNGFAVADPVAPEIRALRLAPALPSATINGLVEPYWIDWPSNIGESPPPVLQGPVGLAVEASDRFVTKGEAVSPYRLELRVDGRPFFETRFEKWSWFDRRQQTVMYDWDPTGRRRLFRLYNPYPTELPFFTMTGDGLLDRLVDGPHRIEVLVADAAGNKTHAAFDVIVRMPAVRRPLARLFDAALLFDEREQQSDDRRFAVVGLTKSFFEPFAARIAAASAAGAACYRVEPPTLPARREFDVRFAFDPRASDPQKWGVFRRAASGTVFLGARHDLSVSTIAASTLEYGTFCLLPDNRPPRIVAVRARQGKRFLTFTVTDDLAGVAPDGVKVWLDDRLAVVEFHPRSGAASASVWWPLRGAREATIVAIDRLGNVARQAIPIRFP